MCKHKGSILTLVLAAVLLSGCGQTVQPDPVPLAQPGEVTTLVVADVTEVASALPEQEALALAEGPAALPAPTAVASGLLTKGNDRVLVDYSNMAQGYVMVRYQQETEQRLKVRIKGPTTTYQYNLTPQEWEAFPLSDGNGSYQIGVFQNVSGAKYASLFSVTLEAALENEFGPFLHSNQYVDFDAAPNTVAKAAELTGELTDPLKKVEAVYGFVVKGMTYDQELAATVTSGYLPVLDTVLEKKSGICFDYAALMTGMLRSQGIPCKLVVGYAGTAYHAWISVWSEQTGWVDGVIFFDGVNWQRMDPTFASSGKGSQAILNYIGDGANYSAKYFY